MKSVHLTEIVHNSVDKLPSSKVRAAKKNSYPTQEKVKLTNHYSDRASVQLLSNWLQLPRSTFYYKVHAGTFDYNLII